MRESLKRRLDSIQEIVSPARAKKLHEYSTEELLNIILDGLNATGNNGRPLAVQDLTDEKLMEIIMEGRRNEGVSEEAPSCL